MSVFSDEEMPEMPSKKKPKNRARNASSVSNDSGIAEPEQEGERVPKKCNRGRKVGQCKCSMYYSKWTKIRSFVFKKLKCTITSIHRQFKVINLFISFIASKGNHLWEFIRDLLKDSAFNPTLLRWEDKETGVFRFVQSEAVAQMWGRKKNNTSMTYEKLSRAMR